MHEKEPTDQGFMSKVRCHHNRAGALGRRVYIVIIMLGGMDMHTLSIHISAFL